MAILLNLVLVKPTTRQNRAVTTVTVEAHAFVVCNDNYSEIFCNNI